MNTYLHKKDHCPYVYQYKNEERQRLAISIPCIQSRQYIKEGYTCILLCYMNKADIKAVDCSFSKDAT